MIPIKEATKIVLNHTIPLASELIPLNDALGKQLAEDLFADRAFPPFNRVAMDGIAIVYSDFEQGQKTFPIVGVQAAGAEQKKVSENQVCMEVMTGAVLPEGLDTVIRYEDLRIENQKATIEVETIRSNQNIHKKGTDRAAGDLIIKKGKIISPAEIGVAATVGKDKLWVSQQPKIVIISTGDELVDIEQKPLAHQIRSSNVHQIAALLKTNGLESKIKHITDDPSATYEQLKSCLNEFDVLILSGGVSKGKFDYIPETLEKLKVEKLFHKVQQKPGKPFWFGKNKANKIVFALPGNPASSFMCTNRYFLPWWRACQGLKPFQYKYVVLDKDFSFKPKLQYFLQAKLTPQENGLLLASPRVGKGSGDLANLADADGFIELEAERIDFKKGDLLPFISYRKQ